MDVSGLLEQIKDLERQVNELAKKQGGGGSSPLTTKGDLYGFGTADSRIPVGANGLPLVANSVEGLGVKYEQVGYAGINPLHSLNAQQGFLINGKISATVASNNLTIAIKGMDGNDPSATNPVYCRIGDTVRTITSALSVTANAGANWTNAGSATYATLDCDYFVYLVYETTAGQVGVKIGFSRMPHCHKMNEFASVNGSDEKTMVWNGNTQGTHECENIGRFSATLSAGAGYTWTIPNAIVINHPITYTRKLLWKCAWTANSGTQPSKGNATESSWYQIKGNELRYVIYLAMGSTTSGGSGGAVYLFDVPMACQTHLANGIVMNYGSWGCKQVYGFCGARAGSWFYYDQGFYWYNGTPYTIDNGDTIIIQGESTIA